VFFSYATVSQKDVTLFISESKITPSVHKHFETEGLSVKIAPYESIKKHVQATVGELVIHSNLLYTRHLNFWLTGPIRQNLDIGELERGVDWLGAEAQFDQGRYPRLPDEDNQKPHWSQWHDQCPH